MEATETATASTKTGPITSSLVAVNSALLAENGKTTASPLRERPVKEASLSRLLHSVLIFNARDDQKDVQKLSKNGDSQPRQTSRVFGNQHQQHVHRPRLLHPHLPLCPPRMDLRRLSQKRRPHLSNYSPGQRSFS